MIAAAHTGMVSIVELLLALNDSDCSKGDSNDSNDENNGNNENDENNEIDVSNGCNGNSSSSNINDDDDNDKAVVLGVHMDVNVAANASGDTDTHTHAQADEHAHTRANVDVNAVSKNGDSALSVACSKVFPDIVRTLLQHGARVELVDKEEDTPLLCVVNNTGGQCDDVKKVVDLLLAHKVSDHHCVAWCGV